MQQFSKIFVIYLCLFFQKYEVLNLNIKVIYPIFIGSSVISAVFRVLQILFGTDESTGLRNNSPFSYLFPVGLFLCLLIIFVSLKLSKGVKTVSEIAIPKYLAPFSFLLSFSFLVDIFLTFNVSNEILFKLESVLGILTAGAFLIFGLILLEKLPLSFLPVLVLPVLYFILKLVGLFLTNIAISNHPASSLNLIKIIFILLFYISFSGIFFSENTGEKISNKIFISLSAFILSLTSVISNMFFTEINISDIAFCIFSLLVSINLINAISNQTLKE